MSIHIDAEKGEIAPLVLLPGDPLRAEYVAQTFLENPRCYNRVRGMLGFTGSYKGQRVSVQGSGMGLPSLSIYVHELLAEYDVKNIIRVGSCGSYRREIGLRDVILAMSASTDSAINKLRFKGMDYAPTADFPLLQKAYAVAQGLGIKSFVGPILSTDSFYGDDPEDWKHWAQYGILGVEMESSALYTLAAGFQARALSILTVSDNLVTGEATSSQERERSFETMIRIALETAVPSEN